MKAKVMRKISEEELRYTEAFKAGMSYVILEEGSKHAPHFNAYVTLKLQQNIFDNMIKEFLKNSTEEDMKKFLENLKCSNMDIADTAYSYGQSVMQTTLVDLEEVFVDISKKIPENLVSSYFKTLHSVIKGE